MTLKGVFHCYVEKNFSQPRLDLITQVNKMIVGYARQGIHNLSVRQLYYQFVARDLIANNQRSYDQIKSVINDGRLAGLISWTAIEDRNRNLQGFRTHPTALAAIQSAKAQFKMSLWDDQPWHPEVWVEKAALEGVVGDMCDTLRVDFMSLRGYNSQSEQWAAGRRFADYIQKGQRPIVFHLGDFDPSGWDMTRDNRERLEMFTGVPVIVQRLALNPPQIEQYDPPPNPLKTGRDGEFTDSRANKFSEEFGDSSFELDALDPPVIQELISNAILRIRDEATWEKSLAEEVSELRELDEVIAQLGGNPDEEEEDET